jgi:enterochelin esterase family protein
MPSVKHQALMALSFAVFVVACAGPSATTPAGSGGTDGRGGAGGAASTGGQSGSNGSGGAISDAPPASGSGGQLAGIDAAGGQSGTMADGAAGSGTGDAGYVGGDKLTCRPTTDGNGKHDLPAGNPPEWTLKPGVAAGKLTASASFASKLYGQHFPYRIYSSANYVQGKPAIFMTFGDGLSQYLGGFHTAAVLDNLIAAGEMPPTVVLFVDPPSDGDRVKTYDPPTPKYAQFLMEEIIPAVISPTFSISKDPDAWATGGYSASGEQGFTVVWNRPDNFHKFIGHNTSFGASIDYNHWIWADEIMKAPMRQLRVSLVTSTNDLADQRGKWIEINTNVANALAAKGNDWRLMIGTGPHSPPGDSQRDFPNALRWMWSGCSFSN